MEQLPTPPPEQPEKTDWDAVKLDWIARNLAATEKAFTLKDVADHWKLNYRTVRNRSSAECWQEALQEAVQERNKKAIAKVVEDSAEDFAEIRKKQLLYIRLTLNKAMLKLQAVDPITDLTPMQALDMQKWAVLEERRVSGMEKAPGIQMNLNQQTNVSANIGVELTQEQQDFRRFMREMLGEPVVEGETFDAEADPDPEG